MLPRRFVPGDATGDHKTAHRGLILFLVNADMELKLSGCAI